MNREGPGLTLFLDVTGIRDFFEATELAHYWLSLGVMLRALAALFMIACTLAFSVRAVRLFMPRLTLPLRWSSILLAGMYVATLGFHALRTIGLFNLPVALVCTAGLGAAAWFVQPTRAPVLWCLQREWLALCRVARLFLRSKYVLASALVLAYVLLIAVRSLLVPPLGWDTLTYHGPRMVHWLQTNQFTYDPGPGPYSFYRHFISGGEALMVWALLPFHSDLLANLTTIVQWVGIGAAVWGLARVIGVREPFASTSGGLAMLFPVLALEMNTGYVEAPLNLALLGGIALAVACLRKPDGRLAVAAAMALGVAAGIKIPGAPPGVIVLAVVLLRLLFLRRLALKARMQWIALSALGAALPMLPWTWEAYSETGYPLSPMPVKVLGWQLGIASPAMEWYQDRPFVVPFTWQGETRALRAMIGAFGITHPGDGPPFGTISVLPLLVALFGLVWLIRKRPLVGLALTAACAAPWAAHFSTGLSVPRLLWAVSVARYLIGLMGMVMAVSMIWCKPDSALAQTYRRLLLLMTGGYLAVNLRHGFGLWELRELVIVAAACLVAGTLLRALLHLPWRVSARVAGAVAMFALACSALQLRRDQTRPLAYRESYALHNAPRFWADAVPFVDDPSAQISHKIALTGGPHQNADAWFYYFFFGSRLQNTVEYVPPTKDGGVAHWGPAGDFAQRVDRDAWVRHIDDRKITDVLTFPPQSVEKTWMDELPQHFEKVSGGGDWGLYRVLH